MNADTFHHLKSGRFFWQNDYDCIGFSNVVFPHDLHTHSSYPG